MFVSTGSSLAARTALIPYLSGFTWRTEEELWLTEEQCKKLKIWDKTGPNPSETLKMEGSNDVESIEDLPPLLIEEELENGPVKEPEISLMSNESPKDKINTNTWLCDSAATSHMKFNTEGMTNLKPCDRQVKVGNGVEMKAKWIGTFVGNILTKAGDLKPVKMDDVLVVPDLWVNLFSLT